MQDIEVANEMLQKVADILEEMGMKYWIDSGTLLSALRDKTINQYDHDIDVRIFPGEAKDEDMPELIQKLWGIGFHVIIENPGKRAQLICYSKNQIMLDLKFTFKDENLLWMFCWSGVYDENEPVVHAYPMTFFEKMGEIKLLGRKYPTPTPIEGYIEHHYGKDWKEFKEKPEDANDTDLIWDYLHDPPCAMSLTQLNALREEFKKQDAPV